MASAIECPQPTGIGTPEIKNTSIGQIQRNLLASCNTLPEEQKVMTQTLLDSLSVLLPNTYAHCVRTASMTSVCGQTLGLTKSEIDELRVSGLLHDIGKLADSAEFKIFGFLSPARQKEIKLHHVRLGFEIVRMTIGLPIAQIVVAHHEQPQNGSEPYPRNALLSPVSKHTPERRAPVSPLLRRQRFFLSLADQLDAMTDPKRGRNNGHTLITSKREIVANLSSSVYLTDSERSDIPRLVEVGTSVLINLFGVQIGY